MSVESFIRQMPKVELDVRLEGAIYEDRLLIIAEQNEIESQIKHFSQWVKLLKNPDYARIHELVQVTTRWFQQPDDLAHVVYELGVTLAKQNVRYAEVSVNPIAFTENGFTFDTFLAALNDGRDRAERAWNVRMAWVLAIPRENPRTADEIARWATTVATRKAGVVGIGLVGQEDAQPAGQFERAFRSAEKKDVACVPHAGSKLGAAGVSAILDHCEPARLVDGWGVVDAPEVMQRLYDAKIPLNVWMTRALREGQIASYADYPLRQLYDDGIVLTLTSGMPALYRTSLTGEYLAAAEACGLSLEEIEELALNSVRASQLLPEEKQAMLDEFAEEYQRLRVELFTDEAQ